MYNILVVDDDKEIVKAIEIYLNKEGYNVLKTYNGTECLETLKENNDKIINKLEVHSKNLTNQAKTVGSDKDYTKIVKYATEYSKFISNTIVLFNEYEIQFV